jgi:cysteine sulfinate desulfinase/cysteine desulfurase-like protein
MSGATRPIYLDYNATTPHDSEVAEAMRPFLESEFGNPSSSHIYGSRPRQAVAEARRHVAALIGTEPENIMFTSGGTESNNYAILGTAWALREKGRHIITSNIEHPAVSQTCAALESEGFDVTHLPVDELGAACRIAKRDFERNRQAMETTRDLLHRRITAACDARLNGHPEHRLPNTLNMSFRGVTSDDLIAAVADVVAVSAGSACHSDAITLSSVIEAIGTPMEWARGTIRFSTGKYTTVEDVERAADATIRAYASLTHGNEKA